MVEDASPVVPTENPDPLVIKKRRTWPKTYKKREYATFVKGFPWFRVRYLLIADSLVAGCPKYREGYLVVSNMNDYVVDAFGTLEEADDKCKYLNQWWERDYRSIKTGNWD